MFKKYLLIIFFAILIIEIQSGDERFYKHKQIKRSITNQLTEKVTDYVKLKNKNLNEKIKNSLFYLKNFWNEERNKAKLQIIKDSAEISQQFRTLPKHCQQNLKNDFENHINDRLILFNNCTSKVDIADDISRIIYSGSLILANVSGTAMNFINLIDSCEHQNTTSTTESIACIFRSLGDFGKEIANSITDVTSLVNEISHLVNDIKLLIYGCQITKNHLNLINLMKNNCQINLR